MALSVRLKHVDRFFARIYTQFCQLGNDRGALYDLKSTVEKLFCTVQGTKTMVIVGFADEINKPWSQICQNFCLFE